MLHWKMHFMKDLMLYLKVQLRVHFKESLKMQKKATKKDTFDVKRDGALKSTFGSAIECYVKVLKKVHLRLKLRVHLT